MNEKASKSFTICNNCEAINRVENNRHGPPKCGRCKVELQNYNTTVDVSLKTLLVLIESSPVPVVVDFWAQWCGPCLGFAPIFSSASKRHAGSFVFAKLNTQEHQAAGAEFGIRGIPTTIIFAKGKELARQSGAMDAKALESFLRNVNF